jgi:2-dehydro-3-deoxyphosphogluconate aldolase / (4S)-4-hydroxy-2-oxoglutarate aldolase
MSLADPAPLFACPVVPVLTVERVEDAVPLARALADGGLTAIEVTLRTPVALQALRAMREALPDLAIGAGTVTRASEVEAAIAAGAAFLVSPGTPPALADALAEAPVPALPGCATVSEAMALAARGFRALKFFPAEPSGGARWLKAVAGPLPHLRFCPTGGIGPANAPDYLALANVVAIGGSWMAPADAIRAGDFARITGLARDAAHLRVR